MALLWPWKRSTDSRKQNALPSELRIATSGSFSIRAAIETLRVDGAGSYTQGGRVRAAPEDSSHDCLRRHREAVQCLPASLRVRLGPSEAHIVIVDVKWLHGARVRTRARRGSRLSPRGD